MYPGAQSIFLHFFNSLSYFTLSTLPFFQMFKSNNTLTHVILGLPIILDGDSNLVHSNRISNLSCDFSLHCQALVVLYLTPQEPHKSVTFTGTHSVQLQASKRNKQSGKIRIILSFFSYLISTTGTLHISIVS